MFEKEKELLLKQIEENKDKKNLSFVEVTRPLQMLYNYTMLELQLKAHEAKTHNKSPKEIR